MIENKTIEFDEMPVGFKNFINYKIARNDLQQATDEIIRKYCLPKLDYISPWNLEKEIRNKIEIRGK